MEISKYFTILNLHKIKVGINASCGHGQDGMDASLDLKSFRAKALNATRVILSLTRFMMNLS